MPYIQIVEFQNETGQTLAGRLHLPLSPFRGAALFAPCFTCSKDITAAKRIAESLSLSGLAVLRLILPALPSHKVILQRPAFTPIWRICARPLPWRACKAHPGQRRRGGCEHQL